VDRSDQSPANFRQQPVRPTELTGWKQKYA